MASSKFKNARAVILAGGVGARLWPVSRKSKPKQFQALYGTKTLLQETYERLQPLFLPEQIHVLTTKEFGALVKEQLPTLPPHNIWFEPAGRGTAAATALAAQKLLANDPQAIAVMVPSDHYIGNPQTFQTALADSITFVSNNAEQIVTLGIRPRSPHTGYGYIEQGVAHASDSATTFYRATRFIEKPSATKAAELLKAGNYHWNAGYFIWSAKALLQGLKIHAPNIVTGVDKYFSANDSDQSEIYRNIPQDSIDKALMEHYSDLAVLPLELDWSDVGDWSSLHATLQKENTANVISGSHVGQNDKNLLVLGGKKLIATAGLTDVVIIDTPDATLVCSRNSVQDVKKIVEKLKTNGFDHVL